MAKRVYEIAKELGLSSREVISALSGLGVVAKSHSSTVEEAAFVRLREAKDRGVLSKLTDAGKTARPERPRRPAKPPAERPAAERPPTPRQQPAQQKRAEKPAPKQPAAEAPVPAADMVAAGDAAAPDGSVPATPVVLRDLTIERGITVSAFASKAGVSPADVIKRLFLLGEQYTVAQSLTDEAAELVANDLGFELKIVSPSDMDFIQDDDDEEDDEADLRARPPVITVMGHVDHGKTLLLDKIRETDVVASEHGGITQHIGAYQVHKNDRAITFIDTPGHEAFTQMRARGAQATDIAVLVVAANDGVMPQTVEAISHAKAAEVPIVVAVNKIDLDDADPQRVRQQLTEHALVPEEWGGDTPFVDVSAKAGQNLEDLLDVLLLVADIAELKANPEARARGVVIEAHLDKGRGPVATVLVQRGTLRAGDAVVAGATWARVRAMLDDGGDQMKEAGPGEPAQVLGFESVPQAGDEFRVVADEKRARSIAGDREHRIRTAAVVARKRVSLQDLATAAAEGETIELNVVLKADVQGSLEAVQDALTKLQIRNVQVRVLHKAVGGITERDIALAEASGAIVIGFNVRPSPRARAMAESDGVDVRMYQIFYKLIEDVEAALKGMLAPEFEEIQTGRAEVRMTFKVPKIGKVAGCYVEEGTITRGSKARLVREGIIVIDSVVDSLRRFKDDVREVASGFECGIGLQDYQDIKEGDVIETYDVREVPVT